MSALIQFRALLRNAPSYVCIAPDAADFTHTHASAPPDLELMQKLVGGLVEHVDSWRQDNVPVQFFCNEEGRLKGMRPNVVATEMLRAYRSRWVPEPPLVGPVVILIGKEVQWN